MKTITSEDFIYMDLNGEISEKFFAIIGTETCSSCHMIREVVENSSLDIPEGVEVYSVLMDSEDNPRSSDFQLFIHEKTGSFITSLPLLLYRNKETLNSSGFLPLELIQGLVNRLR